MIYVLILKKGLAYQIIEIFFNLFCLSFSLFHQNVDRSNDEKCSVFSFPFEAAYEERTHSCRDAILAFFAFCKANVQKWLKCSINRNANRRVNERILIFFVFFGVSLIKVLMLMWNIYWVLHMIFYYPKIINGKIRCNKRWWKKQIF